MSDSRIQRLQRAWEGSRSFEDEVALLREQLRVGELSLARVQAAADAGHMGARFALSDRRQPLSEPSTREPWLPLRELSEYAAFAQVSSPEDFAWRFPGPSLVFDPRGGSSALPRRRPLPPPELAVVRLQQELERRDASQAESGGVPAGGDRWGDLTFDERSIARPWVRFTPGDEGWTLRATEGTPGLLGGGEELVAGRAYRLEELRTLTLGATQLQVLGPEQLYARARALG